MSRLSVSRHGSTDNSVPSVVTFKLTLTRETQLVLRLLGFRQQRDEQLLVRWNAELSYIAKTPRVAGSSRGNGSSAPGVGNVFGKV